MTGTNDRAAAAARNDELIAHAAKLTAWARDALGSAARDLNDAHGSDRKPLTGLTQVVTEAAARVSRLADDIESHRGDASRRVVSRSLAPRPEAPHYVMRYTSVVD